MSDFVSLVASLEIKLKKLIDKLEAVEIKNQQLNLEVEALKDSKKYLEKELTNWEDQYNALKLANSMLGSDDNTTEAKLKINTLIKELDQCIGSLSA
jgi:FtsZ-binding cell division protein ZapB